MIEKILFIQSFILEKTIKLDPMTDEILIWEVYLENFLKSKRPELKFDLLYLPIEQRNRKLTIESFEENTKFNSQMDQLIPNIDFEIDEKTLLCISGTTSHNFLSSKLIAEYFQQRFPKSIITFGGRHASARPYDFDYSDSPIDYVVIGEGEIPLYNLVKKSSKKHEIPIKISQQLVPDLNNLPPVDFSIFDEIIHNFKHLSLNLSRGCPFQCSFCMEKDLTEERFKLWRAYSPSRAVQEVKSMIEYGSQNNIELYGFYDPIFGMKKSWFNKFLDLYETRDDTSFLVETRLDVLNESILKKLYSKNFFMWYGLESYSKEMLLLMKKTTNPTAYLKKFEEIYKIHQELEQPLLINTLSNHPGETIKSYSETFDRLERMVREDNLDVSTIQIRLYRHYPGTYAYNNFDYYQEKCGSEVYFPEWFKNEKLLYGAPYCIQPSSSLSLIESLEIFGEKYKEILELNIKNVKENRPPHSLQKVLNLKQGITKINNYVQNILDFVNENNSLISIEATF
jgi:radical SAM superfamily enzyme YgiQ (UPF0313 family)